MTIIFFLGFQKLLFHKKYNIYKYYLPISFGLLLIILEKIFYLVFQKQLLYPISLV